MPIPSDVRVGSAFVESTLSRRKIPLGRPVSQLKRSPFTPATVAVLESRRCIPLTVSLPVTVSFESTGFSAKSPPGCGALRMCTTTRSPPIVRTSRV